MGTRLLVDNCCFVDNYCFVGNYPLNYPSFFFISQCICDNNMREDERKMYYNKRKNREEYSVCPFVDEYWKMNYHCASRNYDDNWLNHTHLDHACT